MPCSGCQPAANSRCVASNRSGLGVHVRLPAVSRPCRADRAGIGGITKPTAARPLLAPLSASAVNSPVPCIAAGRRGVSAMSCPGRAGSPALLLSATPCIRVGWLKLDRPAEQGIPGDHLLLRNPGPIKTLDTVSIFVVAGLAVAAPVSRADASVS